MANNDISDAKFRQTVEAHARGAVDVVIAIRFRPQRAVVRCAR